MNPFEDNLSPECSSHYSYTEEYEFSDEDNSPKNARNCVENIAKQNLAGEMSHYNECPVKSRHASTKESRTTFPFRSCVTIEDELEESSEDSYNELSQGNPLNSQQPGPRVSNAKGDGSIAGNLENTGPTESEPKVSRPVFVFPKKNNKILNRDKQEEVPFTSKAQIQSSAKPKSKALLPGQAPQCKIKPVKVRKEPQDKAAAVLLSVRQLKIADLENEILDLNRQLEEEKLESHTLRKLYDRQQRDVNRIDHSFESISKWENEYDEDRKLKRAQLQEAKSKINDLESKLSVKDRELCRRLAHCKKLEASLEQKDKAIADVNMKLERLKAREADMKAREADMKAREADMKAKLEALRARENASIDESHTKLVLEKEANEFLRKKIKLLTKHCSILEQQHKEMLNLKERSYSNPLSNLPRHDVKYFQNRQTGKIVNSSCSDDSSSG